MIFDAMLRFRGMAKRQAQMELSHKMLDSMLGNQISLCDAGTGIGKTYAYLVAGIVYSRHRAKSREAFRPILISTSSIALQTAVKAVVPAFNI